MTRPSKNNCGVMRLQANLLTKDYEKLLRKKGDLTWTEYLTSIARK